MTPACPRVETIAVGAQSLQIAPTNQTSTRSQQLYTFKQRQGAPADSSYVPQAPLLHSAARRGSQCSTGGLPAPSGQGSAEGGYSPGNSDRYSPGSFLADPEPSGTFPATNRKLFSTGGEDDQSWCAHSPLPALLDRFHSCGHTLQQQGRLLRNVCPRRRRPSARECNRVCRMIDQICPRCCSSCFRLPVPTVNIRMRLCRLVAAPGGSDFGSTQEFMAGERCAAAWA